MDYKIIKTYYESVVSSLKLGSTPLIALLKREIVLVDGKLELWSESVNGEIVKSPVNPDIDFDNITTIEILQK